MENAPFWIALLAAGASVALVSLMKLRRPPPRLESPDADDLPDQP